MGDFGSVDGYFAMIVDHFEYIKVRFQKTFIFPTDLSDSIKLSRELWTTLGHFRVAFG